MQNVTKTSILALGLGLGITVSACVGAASGQPDPTPSPTATPTVTPTQSVAQDVADALEQEGFTITPDETGALVVGEPVISEAEEAQALDTTGDTDTTGEVQVEVTDAPLPDPIEEDDPRWDCRTMGNGGCGVEIEGQWYVVQFDVTTGLPQYVMPRYTYATLGG